MKILSWTIDEWNVILQIISAGLLGITFFVASLTIYTGYKVGKNQNERMIASERLLEQERTNRLLLELSLRDRSLVQDLAAKDKLSQFAGMKYYLAILGEDSETLRFAEQIHYMLSVSGWKYLGAPKPLSWPPIFVDVEIISGIPRGEKVVGQLIDYLRANGFKVQVLPAEVLTVSSGALTIIVLPKPLPAKVFSENQNSPRDEAVARMDAEKLDQLKREWLMPPYDADAKGPKVRGSRKLLNK